MRNFLRLRFGIGFCYAGVLLLAGETALVRAQVPQLINYQGKLTDLAGDVVADGNYDMRFSLYDAESGGNLVWGPEEWTSSTAQVAVTDGLFRVLLGTHAPLDAVAFDKAYWLEVQVFNEGARNWEILLPRRQFASAPFSLRADTVVAGAIDETSLADGAVTDSKVAASGISATKITSDILDNTVVNWASPGDIGTGTPGSGRFSGLFVDGNVGIGVTAPAEKLEVSGNVKLSQNDGTLVLRTSTHNEPGRYKIKFDNNYAGVFMGDDTQDQHFGFYSNFSSNRTYDVYLKAYGRASGSWGKYIGMTHDGTDGKLITDAGNLLLQPAGNVGIGTTDPAYSLDINGDLRVQGGDIHATGKLFLQGGTSWVEVKSGDPDYGLVIRDHDDSDWGDIRVDANGLNLGYRTIGASHMVISSASGDDRGNVGIGTTSPQRKLHVDGTDGAFVRVDGGSGLSGYEITENGAARWILFFRQWQSDNLIIRDEVGNTDTMTFESGTGNVGIGTSDPEERLHVDGSAQVDGTLTVRDSIVLQPRSLPPINPVNGQMWLLN